MGTSTSPVLLTLPTKENILVPLLPPQGLWETSPVPMRVNHSAPRLMISGMFAQVSTLLSVDGLIPQAALDGMDVLGARLAGPAFDRSHQGRGFAADERPAAAIDLDVEAEVRAEDSFAQQAQSAGFVDGLCIRITANGYSVRT